MFRSLVIMRLPKTADGDVLDPKEFSGDFRIGPSIYTGLIYNKYFIVAFKHLNLDYVFYKEELQRQFYCYYKGGECA